MTQNLIDASGCQIEAVSDILSDLLNGTSSYPGFLAIYGPNVNVLPNSPDGQMLNLFAQIIADAEEFVNTAYQTMDPDQAFGTSLDQRCAINGVVRQAGTNTQQQITITVSQGLTLPGLDLNPTTGAYTVADSQGNQYQLVTTTIFSGAGSQTLAFTAVQTGPISAAPGSITTPVTILLGVTSITNASGPAVVGTSTETDAALRIRRAKSVSLPSKGFLQGLEAGLLSVPGVTSVKVWENNGATTDATGTAGHTVWPIVLGGAPAAIAQAIYVKRNAGPGQRGAQSVPITQVDGTIFDVLFDFATEETLYIEFSIAALTGPTPDPVYLAAQIRAAFVFQINQTATASSIMALVQSIYPGAYTSGEGVSADNVTFAALLAPTAINYVFDIPANAIKINGTPQ
jgi:uncharacterized phage protein gp47/JayE